MSVAWLTAVLGAGARFKMEAAWDADLSDADGSSWTWTEVAIVRHDPGTSAVMGRSDNVGQAGAARLGFSVDNTSGDYTAGNPLAAHNVKQNTPIRYLLSLDALATFSIRFQGYLDSANPTTAPTGTADKRVAITALGMLGRLAGLKKPLRSALYRATQADSEVIAHWPMEDGTDATSAASAKAGVGPMVAYGPVALPKFADAGPVGAATGINFKAGALTAQITNATVGSFRAQAAIRINNIAGPSATDILWSIETSGGGLFELTYYTSTNSLEWTYVSPNATGGTAFSIKASDGQWHLVTINVLQSGADIICHTYVDGGSHFSFTIHTDTLGKITTVTVGAGNIITTPVIGVVATDFNMSALSIASPATEPPPALANTAAALGGYVGETVDARLTRLCAEENIDLDLRGTSAVTMGPQGVDTIANLLREGEAADHGTLYDGFGPGLGYQCRSDRYDASAALTLDMGANPPEVAPPFEPKFDRQALKNLYAVTRKGGGSATVEQVDGPNGTALVGVEDAAPTINIDTDDPLPAHAGWLVALGTVPGFRYPSVVLNMLGIPAKAADVLAMTLGERVTIFNPASKAVDLPPDPIDLIVEGWTETTTMTTWGLVLNCSPYAPDRIIVIDTDRIDTTASTLHAAITSSATTITVDGNADGSWSTAAGDYPVDVICGGERMTLTTAPTGGPPTQTFTGVTRHVNGVTKAHSALDPISLFNPAIIGL